MAPAQYIFMLGILFPLKTLGNFPTDRSRNHFVLESISTFTSSSLASIPNSQWLKDFKKLYKKETSQKLVNYPVVENFEVVLFPLVTNQHCLVVVNNFRNTTYLPPLSVPIILRSFEPIVSTKIETSGKFENKVLWGPRVFTSKSTNWTSLGSDSDDLLKCEYSKYLLGVDLKYQNRDDFCLRINLPRFLLKTKPWNCQVQFHLHYGVRPLIDKIVPRLFWSRPEKMTRYNSFPPSVSPINVLIGVTNTHHQKDIDLVRKWMGESDASKNYVKGYQKGFTELFLMIEVQIITQDHYLSLKAGKLEKIILFRICPHCFLTTKRQTDIISVLKLGNITDKINVKALPTLAAPTTNENFLWEFTKSDEGWDVQEKINILDYMILKITSCGRNHNYMKPYINLHHRVVGLLAEAYARLWLSIMRNYTIKDFDNQHYCENGLSKSPFQGLKSIGTAFVIQLGQQTFFRSRYHFPYFPKDPLNQLQFLGCGKRELDFPFVVLTIAYDDWVWLASSASCLAIIMSIPLLYTEGFWGNLRRHFMSPIILLLEQGDGFTEKVMKNEKVRFVVGLFCLMAVVLSNAYKNTNVYTMITPRQPEPYRSFIELVEEGFTIYTRPATTRILDKETRDSNSVNYASFVTEGNIYTAAVWSEVDFLVEFFTFLKVILRKLAIMDGSANVSNSTLVSLGIQNHSILHDQFKHVLTQMVQNATSQAEVYANVTEEEIPKLHEKYLVRSIEQCNRVGIILPGYMCPKYIQKMNNTRNRKYISIGMEIYSDLDWMFTIESYAPPHLIWRIKRISESGAWDKWLHVFMSGLPIDDNGGGDVPTPAEMSGNIFIIFTVWLCGLAFSIAIFVLEWMLRITMLMIIRLRYVKHKIFRQKKNSTVSKVEKVIINCSITP